MKKWTLLWSFMCLNLVGMNLSCRSEGATNDSIANLKPVHYKVFLMSQRKLQCLHPSLKNTDWSINYGRSVDGNTIYLYLENEILSISSDETKIIPYKKDHIAKNSMVDVDEKGDVIAIRKGDWLTFSSGYSVFADAYTLYEFTEDRAFYVYERDEVAKLFSVKHPEISLLTIPDFDVIRLFRTKNYLYLAGTHGRNWLGSYQWVVAKIVEADGCLKIHKIIKLSDENPIDISPDGKKLLFLKEVIPPHPELGTYLSTYDVEIGMSDVVYGSPGWIYRKGLFVTDKLWNRLEQLAKEGGYSGKMEFQK
jgi:hypothetical protein